MDSYILIADDEENVRIALDKNLTKNGYKVITATTINEANEKIKIKDIDVAVVDLNFLGENDFGGIKIIENINKLQPTSKIIVFTGYNESDEIKDKLKDLNYNSFLSKGAPGNYIVNLLKELEILKKERTKKNCFVIMPFSGTRSCTEPEWTDCFNLVIRPAVEKAGFNYKCTRNEQSVGGIIQNVIKNLNSAELVIADLTDQNANVFYELGVRHTLNTPTILITQNIKEVPFDLQNYMCIEYNQKPAGVKKFYREIKKAIKEIETSQDKINFSPVGDYLQLNE